MHTTTPTHALPTTVRGALARELPPTFGIAPEWVHLLPTGPELRGSDGRQWRMPDPSAVVAATQARLPLPIDYMHASEHRREDGTGTEAPAAGWVVELEARADGVWGRVEWTPRGADAVRNREYRFLSPAFTFGRTDRAVAALTSVGLVHRPNFRELAALNSEGEGHGLTAEELAFCRDKGIAPWAYAMAGESAPEPATPAPPRGPRPERLTGEELAFCARKGLDPACYLLAAQQEWDRGC